VEETAALPPLRRPAANLDAERLMLAGLGQDRQAASTRSCVDGHELKVDVLTGNGEGIPLPRRGDRSKEVLEKPASTFRSDAGRTKKRKDVESRQSADRCAQGGEALRRQLMADPGRHESSASAAFVAVVRFQHGPKFCAVDRRWWSRYEFAVRHH